ncbi:hypothetical protein ARMGADRAFT_945720 [Armillaria gallica]|uniref:Retrovirus-related Pol polyprotein from transposon TNT 1-94-like beta-barrel domain-containing protein n=1 Tax=Armillaria gallica TaxID=47427 RepID=A0A2H3CUV0_ARMGA|nr:hypothetical protein ARMGADRAFT_945720 [Armillaria gallica]
MKKFSLAHNHKRVADQAGEHSSGKQRQGGRKAEKGSGFAAEVKEETASLRSTNPSSPTVSHWNTDTGASHHMTPHRHWFHMYSPHIIPIHLADNTVIHSAGVGSVVFKPEIEGEVSDEVEFHDVLHVPEL